MNENLTEPREPRFHGRSSLQRRFPAVLAIALAGFLCHAGQPWARGATLAWTPSAGNSVWDTTTANWSGDATYYADGDIVVFGDAGLSGSSIVISSTSGEVNPGEIDVMNDFGTYDISGDPIAGGCELVKSGSGTLILSSSNSYSGGTIIDGGTLVIDTDGANSTTTGFIAGQGTLVKTGSGNFTIGGAVGNSSTSTCISIQQGSLTLTNVGTQYITMPTTAGNFSGDLIIGAREMLDIEGNSDFSQPVQISGSGTVYIAASGASILVGGPDQFTSGAVEIDNNIVMNSQSQGQPFSTTFGTSTSSQGATLSSQLVLNGVLSGNSNVTFTSDKFDAPYIFLNAPALYTGTTFLNFGYDGVLQIGASNAFPVTTQLIFGTYSGAVDLNGFNQEVSGLTDNGNQGSDNGITNTGTTTSILTVNQAGNSTFAGNIGTPDQSGPGTNIIARGPDLNNISFVKDGAGSLRLTGNETYTGSTTGTGGTLVVDGAITQTSRVDIWSGATLGGVGSITVAPGGQVVIHKGGTMAPEDDFRQNPTGEFFISDTSGTPSSAGTFDLEEGGTLFISLQAFEAGGSQDPSNNAGGWDSQLAVAGNISLSGSLAGTLLSGFTANVGDLFFIILNQGGNPVHGTFEGNPSTVTFSGAGQTVTFDISYTGDANANPPTFTGSTGNDVVLEVEATSVPEPVSGAICLAGLGLLMVRGSLRRRRQ